MYFLFQSCGRRVVAAPPLWPRAASPSRGTFVPDVRWSSPGASGQRISHPAAAAIA